MYRRFDPMLRGWADDPAIKAVLIRGAGERAFCAGGDVRAIYEAGRGISGDRSLTAVFFREEYELIRRIHRYPKPYVAIIDGITMGGGAGVSVNGAYRVATERTMLAMPETGIGLFPDVGATRFLNLCPGRIGRYLGLTGARVGAADALYCGFATHFVPRERVPALIAALAAERRRSTKSSPALPPIPGRRRWRRGSRDRPLLRRRHGRGDPRCARTRGGGGRGGCRMGRRNPRRPHDEIADQPQDHLAPADHRPRLCDSRRRSPSNTG